MWYISFCRQTGCCHAHGQPNDTASHRCKSGLHRYRLCDVSFKSGDPLFPERSNSYVPFFRNTIHGFRIGDQKELAVKSPVRSQASAKSKRLFSRNNLNSTFAYTKDKRSFLLFQYVANKWNLWMPEIQSPVLTNNQFWPKSRCFSFT